MEYEIIYSIRPGRGTRRTLFAAPPLGAASLAGYNTIMTSSNALSSIPEDKSRDAAPAAFAAPPPGARILPGAEAREFLARRPGWAERIGEPTRGVAFDQRAWPAAAGNFVLAALFLPIAGLVWRHMWEYGFLISGSLLAGYFTVIGFFDLYWALACATDRVWLFLGPGGALWIRRTPWGTRTRLFAPGDAEELRHGRVNGGGDGDRQLSVKLRTGECRILLADGPRPGLSAWAARPVAEALGRGAPEILEPKA